MLSLPCPPAQWTRFSALLDAVMDLPEDARAAWLDTLAGEDAALKPWLARVLGSQAGTHAGFMRPGADAFDETLEAGANVGPYRLECLLGEGGMGAVWRASRQDEGPRREVALKLPHPGLLSAQARARFARERDVLAALCHPHIAQLYDAGVSVEGRPYLALELVQGKSITDACRESGASLDRRLALVGEVLEALSFAHQRLIVHRDIKPSNVLVTPEGATKLLDFGIAKLLRPTETQDLMLTQPQSRLATPAYAAPEQLSDGPITVATDVFSAGVLLFELVTGHRPFASAPTGADAVEAPRASQRADASAAELPDGRVGSKRLARTLRGDLDAVIARALALAPTERYGSAEAFARDLRRYRQGMPVAARRVGWTTVVRKFVRRNRVPVIFAAVLLLALAAGTAGVAWQNRRAEREAARATAIKDFLIGLFEQSDKLHGDTPAGSLTAKDLLDIGADRASSAFVHDPEIELELLETIGNINDVLGDGPRSESAWGRRLDVARSLYGPEDPRVVEGSLRLAMSEVEFLDDEKAKALLETIREPVFARYGPESLQRAQWLLARAHSLRATHGGRDEALQAAAQSLAIYETHFPADSDHAEAIDALAGYQYDAERYAEALATTEKERALKISQHNYGAIDALMYFADAAGRHQRLGHLALAESIYLQEQTGAEHELGRDSQWYLHAITSRALLASVQGDRFKANALFKDAMALTLSRTATTGLVTSLGRAYGAALAREGRAQESLPYLEAALTETRLHGRDEQNLRRTEGFLGDAYDQAGRPKDARPLLLAARTEWMLYGPQAGSPALTARERWAQFLLDQGDVEAAAKEFDAVVHAPSGMSTAPQARAAAGLARIALRARKPAEADLHTQQALKILDSITMEYDVRARVEVWLARCDTLLALGRTAEAADWAQKAAAAAAIYDAAGSPQLAQAEAAAQRVKAK